MCIAGTSLAATGALAIIISAYNPENVSLIVEVLRPHVPHGGRLSMMRDERV
jgi:hypothetical protein